MSSTLLGYFGFVVATLILIWAVLEMGRRINDHRNAGRDAENRWVRFDVTHTEVGGEKLPLEDHEDAEVSPEQSLQMRAKQNGHFTESKKTL